MTEPNTTNTRGKKRVLTARQRLWADNYLICLNKKEAAILAGYAPKAADAQGSYISQLPQVVEYVTRKQAVKSKKFDMQLDDILSELKLIAFARMGDFVEDDGDGHPRFKAISSIPGDKLAALETLAFDRIERTEMWGRGEDTWPVAEVSTKKVKFAFSKKAALETLGKHLGMKTGSAEGQGADPNVPRKVVIEGGLPEGGPPAPRDDSEEPKRPVVKK